MFLNDIVGAMTVKEASALVAKAKKVAMEDSWHSEEKGNSWSSENTPFGSQDPFHGEQGEWSEGAEPTKTVAKTWDQLSKQERLSGVKGRTVWNEKTRKYTTVFDVPATEQVVAEADQLNLNDDDWYEVNTETKSIVRSISQRPQQSDMGRPVKLPNGNYAMKGMTAKHMGLTRGVAEGEVVPLGKKHSGDLGDIHSCPKCGGDLQGGNYQGHRVKVCQPCKQVYLPPNSGIDQQGNKTNEQGVAEGNFDDANRDIANSQMHKLTKTHTSDCGYRYGHDCDCGGTKTHAGDCGYKYGHDCDCGLAKSKEVDEAAGPAVWEVHYDYGPHQSNEVKVKASSKEEACAKVKRLAKTHGQNNIMINWARPADNSVTESVAETLPLNDAVKVLRHYGADHFKTTSDRLNFYKNGRPFGVDLVMNPDSTRSATLSSLNSATRGLKGQGVAEAQNDYFKRRRDEEDRIAGTKAPAKRTPKQTDYEKKRKQQDVTEGKSYWDKLQGERNTKVNTLISELRKSIKGIK